MSDVRLIDANALLERVDEERKYLIARGQTGAEHILVHNFRDLIDNAPTVESEELRKIRNICEHWNDESSSFVSACNAFEDILAIFGLGVSERTDMGE